MAFQKIASATPLESAGGSWPTDRLKSENPAAKRGLQIRLSIYR